MNRKIHKFLFIACIFLLAVFCIRLVIDYSNYNETFSAPFSVYVGIRSIEFLLPAVILLIAGLILRRRNQKIERSSHGSNQNSGTDQKV